MILEKVSMLVAIFKMCWSSWKVKRRAQYKNIEHLQNLKDKIYEFSFFFKIVYTSYFKI